MAGRVSHQAAHAGQLTDLVDRTAGAGVRHHGDGVEGIQGRLQCVGDLVGGFVPHADDALIALLIGEQTVFKRALDLLDLFLRLVQQLRLFLRNHNVGHRNGDRADSGIFEAQRFDAIQPWRSTPSRR